MPKAVSLDQIMAERQFSVKSTPKGDALTKIFKAPASWNANARTARFIMTAQVTDRYGDVVVSNGGQLTEFNTNPIALWAHNSRGFPIGMWSDINVVTGKPRRMEGTVNLTEEETTGEADTVAKLLSQGMVRACSIGFIPKVWESIRDEDERVTGYEFKEWELLECSVCSIPANPAALVKAAGGDEGLALQAIELVLDEWSRTPEGLIVPREEYEKAYRAAKRDKATTVCEVRSVDEGEGTEETVERASVSNLSGITINIDARGQDKDAMKDVGSSLLSQISKLLGLAPKEKGADTETDQAEAPVAPGDPPLEVDPSFEKDIEDFENAADEEEELRERQRALELLS